MLNQRIRDVPPSATAQVAHLQAAAGLRLDAAEAIVIVSSTPDRRIVFVNAAFARLTGFDAAVLDRETRRSTCRQKARCAWTHCCGSIRKPTVARFTGSRACIVATVPRSARRLICTGSRTSSALGTWCLVIADVSGAVWQVSGSPGRAERQPCNVVEASVLCARRFGSACRARRPSGSRRSRPGGIVGGSVRSSRLV